MAKLAVSGPNCQIINTVKCVLSKLFSHKKKIIGKYLKIILAIYLQTVTLAVVTQERKGNRTLLKVKSGHCTKN